MSDLVKADKAFNCIKFLGQFRSKEANIRFVIYTDQFEAFDTSVICSSKGLGYLAILRWIFGVLVGTAHRFSCYHLLMPKEMVSHHEPDSGSF